MHEGSDNLAFDLAMHQNGITTFHPLAPGHDRAY